MGQPVRDSWLQKSLWPEDKIQSPLSFSCCRENRKPGFVFTHGLPCVPTGPPHCRPPLASGVTALLSPRLNGPPDEASHLAAPSFSLEVTVHLATCPLPSFYSGIQPMWLAGGLVSDFSLGQSGRSDHFLLNFNLIFLAKVSAILRMWCTWYQYLHRHIFLNVLSMWVCGPKDDTCGN